MVSFAFISQDPIQCEWLMVRWKLDVQVLAEVEARLDFDEDLPPLDGAAVSRRVVGVAEAVQVNFLSANRRYLWVQPVLACATTHGQWVRLRLRCQHAGSRYTTPGKLPKLASQQPLVPFWVSTIEELAA